MKLTLPRAPLAKALDFVTRAAERRTTIPILSNVRLEADACGWLTLVATDLDLEATVSVDARIDAAGALTVAAATLHDLVKKLADKADVTLESLDGDARLSVRAGRAKFALQALPVADWPDITTGQMSHVFSLPAKTLARALAKVSFAISTEETRYYLNGIYMHVAGSGDGAKLRFVATDGHRLARFECDAPQGAEGMPGIIIPSKCCKEIANLAKAADDAGAFKISLNASKILFEIDRAAIVSKLIDGSYPDYERIIPKNEARATLNRAEMAQATERVATISSERGRAVKLDFSDAKLALSVTNPDIGAANEEIDADCDAGPLQIGFNARYLTEVLSTLDGDEVTVELGDSGSPTIFRSPAAEDLLVVLMPMRVS